MKLLTAEAESMHLCVMLSYASVATVDSDIHLKSSFHQYRIWNVCLECYKQNDVFRNSSVPVTCPLCSFSSWILLHLLPSFL